LLAYEVLCRISDFNLNFSSTAGRVVPLSQIHSLRPSLQPRAWLDVMASAHTTRDDKNEAMQEILILAKDKVGSWKLLECFDMRIFFS
jgi:hypothetical protein